MNAGRGERRPRWAAGDPTARLSFALLPGDQIAGHTCPKRPGPPLEAVIRKMRRSIEAAAPVVLPCEVSVIRFMRSTHRRRGIE
jgi:hypothetical protein